MALAYSGAFSANGGTSPFTWTVIAGALPSGLNIGQDGSVSGTPTIPGTFTFTVQVTDKRNASSNASGSIKVYPRLVASLIPACAQTCSVEQGCVNVCGNFGSLTGGVGPYKYASSGNIPKGESLNGLSLAGSFPALAQFWQFTVIVTDALGATATVTPTFYVYPHISVASGSCLGNYITGCSVQLRISGGNPNGRVSVKLVANGANPNQGCWSPGPPPPGYSLSAAGGVVTVVIPKAIGNGYGAVWTIAVSDQSVCGSGADCVSRNATVTIGVQCG